MVVKLASHSIAAPYVAVSGWYLNPGAMPWGYDYGFTLTDPPIYDVVARLLGSTRHLFADVDVRELFGWIKGQHSHTQQQGRDFGGFHIAERKYKSPDDDEYSSNLLNSYVLNVDSQSRVAKRLISRDSIIRHHNLVGYGSTSADYTPREFQTGSRVVLGTVLPSFTSVHWPFPQQEADENGPINWVLFEDPVGQYAYTRVEVDQYRPFAGPMLPVLDYLQSVSSSYAQTFAQNEHLVRFELRKFSYSISPRSIDWEYDFFTEITLPGSLRTYSMVWRVRSGLTLAPTNVAQDFIPGWHTPTGMIVNPYYSYSLLEGSHTYLVGGLPHTDLFPHVVGNVIPPRSYDYALEYGPSVESTPGWSLHLDSVTDQALVVVASDHGSFWERELPELRKSAVYSFHNAIENSLLLMKNNYLEVLKELPELPELIPDIVGLIRILSLANRTSLLKTGGQLGDWITKFNLQYSFGIAPTGGVLDELNRRGPRLLQLVRDGEDLERNTVYGTFRYRFTEDQSWGAGSELITRTKVNFTYARTPIWNVILGLYGVRLLPSLQNIWELIPGSFVVDWFTNMSARFKHVDLSLLQLALSFNYFEHSFSITSGLSDDNTVWGFLSGEESRLIAKYYARDISFTVPQLSESKYDFLRVQGSPDTGILGSLIYQFLK